MSAEVQYFCAEFGAITLVHARKPLGSHALEIVHGEDLSVVRFSTVCHVAGGMTDDNAAMVVCPTMVVQSSDTIDIGAKDACQQGILEACAPVS